MIDLPVLMTASVDPKGMPTARWTPLEREKMYVETLQFYMKDFGKREGHYDFVFAENSGWDKERILSQIKVPSNIKLEYIALNPNDYDVSRLKGYNEALMIDQATLLSEAIHRAGRFFKVTGRYPFINLYRLLREVDRRAGKDMQLYADCKDHNMYQWLHLPLDGHRGETRYYAVSLEYYDKHFRGRYKKVQGSNTVEDLMLYNIRKHKGEQGVYGRFRTQPHISGLEGSYRQFNSRWMDFFDSKDNDSFVLTVKRYIRQVLRWTMPWWKV